MTDVSGDPILYKSGEFNNENTDTQKYYRTRDASGNIISSTPMWEYKDGAGWHWIGISSRLQSLRPNPKYTNIMIYARF